MKNNNCFCTKPYTFFEIGTNGDCFLCCRMWNNSYCVGNILKQSFQEIWNGEKAIKFRKTIIDKTYKYCNTELCIPANNTPIVSPIAQFPKEISLCYDNTCVQQCVYCRDKPHVMSKEDQAIWDAKIDSDIIPMMKEAELVTVNVAGEVFISEHSKKLIKKASASFPNLNFAIITNGILCCEENLKELGISERIVDIRISLPSCVESTYNKIVRNGNYNNVMKNIEYVSSLKKSGKIKVFHINCVLSSLNYKDLIQLTKYAKEHDAVLHVMLVQDMGQETNFLKQIDRYLVTKPTHPEYNNFIKIMNNPIIKYNKDFLINDSFRQLQPVSFLKILKNKINFYKKYGYK